ncbi:hypothetical protein EAG_05563 [Camponotus floridanus]|uniref:Uncharacterized protein n=1 Tax=Camponotus floridanus TaxID=104421 RepID=E1ZZR0_CAMFO|nr:hypothetical protein EAG_05563 [Camponotus floridanus]
MTIFELGAIQSDFYSREFERNLQKQAKVEQRMSAVMLASQMYKMTNKLMQLITVNYTLSMKQHVHSHTFSLCNMMSVTTKRNSLMFPDYENSSVSSIAIRVHIFENAYTPRVVWLPDVASFRSTEVAALAHSLRDVQPVGDRNSVDARDPRLDGRSIGGNRSLERYKFNQLLGCQRKVFDYVFEDRIVHVIRDESRSLATTKNTQNTIKALATSVELFNFRRKQAILQKRLKFETFNDRKMCGVDLPGASSVVVVFRFVPPQPGDFSALLFYFSPVSGTQNFTLFIRLWEIIDIYYLENAELFAQEGMREEESSKGKALVVSQDSLSGIILKSCRRENGVSRRIFQVRQVMSYRREEFKTNDPWNIKPSRRRPTPRDYFFSLPSATKCEEYQLPYDILFLFSGEKVQKETVEILYWRSKDKRTCIKLTIHHTFRQAETMRDRKKRIEKSLLNALNAPLSYYVTKVATRTLKAWFLFFTLLTKNINEKQVLRRICLVTLDILMMSIRKISRQRLRVFDFSETKLLGFGRNTSGVQLRGGTLFLSSNPEYQSSSRPSTSPRKVARTVVANSTARNLVLEHLRPEALNAIALVVSRSGCGHATVQLVGSTELVCCTFFVIEMHHKTQDNIRKNIVLVLEIGGNLNLVSVLNRDGYVDQRKAKIESTFEKKQR